jgi:hypothetical protein
LGVCLVWQFNFGFKTQQVKSPVKITQELI